MIEVRNLSKAFKKKQVLRDINMSFGHGVYGLLGPNGAGKTTLLRCMTGVYPVAKGTILVDGMDAVNSPSYACALGYLPQKFGLFKGMKVSEMLLYFATVKNVPKEKQQQDIQTCLEWVGLTDRANDKVRTLSGGMIRRLGIAQALLGDPALVILDEPTAGLDPEERVRFKNLIAKLPKDKTVILSTHIVEDVAALCDQIIILSEGRVEGIGSGEQIATYAEGKVYSVLIEQESALTEPYFIAQRNERILRVLSAQPQPGTLLTPTIEDGYLCKVKGYA